MNETDSTTDARSRWFITPISIALAAIAAIMVLVTIGGIVTVYVVTEKYDDLHEAVKEDDIFAVRCFLLRGADVNAKDEYGNTPLHFAAWHGHREVIEVLIDKGANVNSKAGNGLTPLELAVVAAQKDIPALLRKHGAKE